MVEKKEHVKKYDRKQIINSFNPICWPEYTQWNFYK